MQHGRKCISHGLPGEMGFLPLVTISCPEPRSINSSPYPAHAAARLWAGYGELVGENSISPGKPCEMHISPHVYIDISSEISDYKADCVKRREFTLYAL